MSRNADDKPTSASQAGSPADPDRTIDSDATLTAAGPAARTTEMPDAIGPYQIVRRLGEGGMGEVFLARQSEPIKRMVALKIIKPGMDTRAVVARFAQERQTLALMNHPGIAQVYEAGETEQGRPYFAMEYVAGVPITAYCDEHHLTTRQRLELMTDVCAAVQHAHQKAVIHRDLKPGNILVSEVDGRPVPKVIDFGIARATEQRAIERSVFTQFGNVIGTPAYMSPEQTDPTNTDIDTRTDIYSLGVVLYELLVGLTPFDTESVYSAGYDAIMKFVREQEAPRPSVRLQESASHTTEIAASQGVDTARLVRTLRGDPDWIVLKSLDKDRTRRYETANAMAMDIRRYLNDEPVLASPPSASYLARKFVRRHRTGVVATVAAAIVLVAFTLTTSLQKRVIARERDRAEQESAKALAVKGFLQDMLVSSDPWSGGDHDMTVVEAMDAARADIDSIFADQPYVAAEMHATMGKTYLGLQQTEAAEAETRRGLEMQTALMGPDADEVATSWKNLAQILRFNMDMPGAIAAGEELVRITRLHHAPDSEEMVSANDKMLDLLVIDRQFDAADSVLTLIDEIIAGSPNDWTAQRAAILNFRGRIAVESENNLPKADSLYCAAIELLRNKLPKSPARAIYLNNAAVNQVVMQDYDRARQTYTETLAFDEEIFGKDHPEYAIALENMGGIAFRQGDYEACLANLEHVRDIRARKMGANHPTVMRTMLNMATVASVSGKPEQAIEVYGEVLPKLVAVNGEMHVDTATTLRNLALALHRAGRDQEAEAAIDRARPIFRELYGERHQQSARLEADLGMMRVDQKRWPEAEKLTRGAYEVFLETVGAEDPRTVKAAATLAKIYDKLGRAEDAARFRESR